MVERGIQRRLAAILAADVVGYSRLMGDDEAGTHGRLKALRRELLEPRVADHHGRIVKLTGDGVLVEFASVVDAVTCAVEVQAMVAERNADQPESRKLEFRVGVNLGDVIIEDDDIYGDGVNIAARLQGLAQPGAVCISDLVRQMVLGRVDFAFEDLGAQRVKNIAEPLRVWQWTTDMRAELPAGSTTIAVLPFDNMSADSEQGYFSDGITEDLITDLSQISGLDVVGRNAVFRYKGEAVQPQQVSGNLGVRYVLEGSVRRAAKRLRMAAQMIDAATGFHLWAQLYDRVLEDIFDLQDEITHEIVAALKVHLSPRELVTIARRHTENLEAYDLIAPGL